MKKTKRFNICKYLPIDNPIISKVGLAFLLALAFFLVVFIAGSTVHASGLVDETINAGNEYSKYALAHYQLDFYVDTSWDWLPWNWGDGIGKQVQYALYSLTAVIWHGSLYLSSATGYMVQEAYSLDFIAQTADSVGRNIQTIAGVSPSGITTGFYSGFLLLFVLVVGVYVAYTGLIKRETSKAIRAVINFVVIFILSASVIAFAPDYIKKINEFSTDVSTASLTMGTSMIMPNTSSNGRDSVDLIRDNLFSIQVKQPWLLLQFGTTDISSLGEDRVNDILSVHPDTNKGKDRENAVKDEIEDNDNVNLTITKTGERLGMVLFLFLFNIFISLFVFLLTGIMIFSQILFIIYAMFLPVSFLMSTLPTFEGTSKRAIVKLFNTVMQRAGITLVITIAFSISTMLYALAGSSPFFLIAFLQIVTFGGIFFKLNDLMNMFALRSDDSQNFSRRMMMHPRRMARRGNRYLGRMVAGTAGFIARGSRQLGSSIKRGFTGASKKRDTTHGKQSPPPNQNAKTGQGSPYTGNHHQNNSSKNTSADNQTDTQRNRHFDTQSDSSGQTGSNEYQKDSTNQEEKKGRNNLADKRLQQGREEQERQKTDKRKDSHTPASKNRPAPAHNTHERPNKQTDSKRQKVDSKDKQVQKANSPHGRPSVTNEQTSPTRQHTSSAPIRDSSNGDMRPSTIESTPSKYGRTGRAYVEKNLSQTEKEYRQQKRQDTIERVRSIGKKKGQTDSKSRKGRKA